MNRVQIEICFRLCAVEKQLQNILAQFSKIRSNDLIDEQVSQELTRLMKSLMETRGRLNDKFRNRRLKTASSDAVGGPEPPPLLFGGCSVRAKFQARISMHGDVHGDMTDTFDISNAFENSASDYVVGGDDQKHLSPPRCKEEPLSAAAIPDSKDDVVLTASVEAKEEDTDVVTANNNRANLDPNDDMKIECNEDCDMSDGEDWFPEIKDEFEKVPRRRRHSNRELEGSARSDGGGGNYSNPLIECEICGKRLNRTNIYAHRKIHSGEKPFACSVCGKAFSRKLNMQVHLATHNPRERVVCENCGKTLLTQKSLQDHLEKGGCEKHRAKQKEKKEAVELTCNICGKTVKSEWALRMHLQVHSQEKPYSCEVCGESFRRPYEVNKHRMSRHEQPTCDVCAKSFNSVSSLNRHVQVVHTDERPFSCDVCGKAYKEKQTLEKHRLVHNKQMEDPPLHRHHTALTAVAAVREATVDGSHQQPLFKCEMCAKSFALVFDLKAHYEKVHGLESLPVDRLVDYS